MPGATAGSASTTRRRCFRTPPTAVSPGASRASSPRRAIGRCIPRRRSRPTGRRSMWCTWPSCSRSRTPPPIRGPSTVSCAWPPIGTDGTPGAWVTVASGPDRRRPWDVAGAHPLQRVPGRLRLRHRHRQLWRGHVDRREPHRRLPGDGRLAAGIVRCRPCGIARAVAARRLPDALRQQRHLQRHHPLSRSVGALDMQKGRRFPLLKSRPAAEIAKAVREYQDEWERDDARWEMLAY